MAYLTKPLNTKKLDFKNRLVMPPMATGRADENGYVTEAHIKYYYEKTQGGNLALVICEHAYVNRQGRLRDTQLSIAEDGTIAGLSTLAQSIHANGSKVAIQINHAGSAEPGSDSLAPSAILHPRMDSVPKAMTAGQIKQVILDFKDAAARVKKAGFDAVEIHSAHGYLLNQFYSPLTNQRTDEYGGSLKNRIRIHLEIIRAIRESVGDDFPILIRLGGSDYRDGGSTIEDSVDAARAFEEAGVDILDISGGFSGTSNPRSTDPGYFSDVSIPVKGAVSIPVILTGGITTGQQADELLSAGAADLIGVGRGIFNDSSWPAKALASVE